MEDTPSWIPMFCTCSLRCDHGQEEELQHDMSPCPDIVKVDVSSLNAHERSPQIPEFPSRTVFLSSVWTLCVCIPSDGTFKLSSSAITQAVNAMINANTVIFISERKKKVSHSKNKDALFHPPQRPQ